MDLTVSIVSHDSILDLKALMPSLQNSLKCLTHEVLLVENQADSKVVRFIQTEYPEVKLMVNKTPLGYGANHNQNLQRAKGKYIIFMNSDIIVTPEALSILCEFMESNVDVGMCSPNVLNPDGSLQYLNKGYPSILDLFLRRLAPLHKKKGWVKTRMDDYEMRDIGYDRSVDVPFISGCFMLCRTSIAKNVKGFDERYYLYFEDADLCRKIQRGYRTVSCPDASVIHRWERSSYKSLKWLIVFIKSAVRYFNKWGYRFC